MFRSSVKFQFHFCFLVCTSPGKSSRRVLHPETHQPGSRHVDQTKSSPRSLPIKERKRKSVPITAVCAQRPIWRWSTSHVMDSDHSTPPRAICAGALGLAYLEFRHETPFPKRELRASSRLPGRGTVLRPESRGHITPHGSPPPPLTGCLEQLQKISASFDRLYPAGPRANMCVTPVF